LLIDGSGRRTAESYDGVRNAAPLLHIQYAYLAPPPPPPGTIVELQMRVGSSSDDVEEQPNGWLYTNSSDLEMVQDGTATQAIGLRYAGLSIPKGATILDAWIQFTVDERSTGPVGLRIRANDVGNAAGFSGNFDVSGRAATTASVMWLPPDWTSVGQAGPGQRTASLVSLVQAIVNRADWAPGNAMAFLIDGTGWRNAVSYDGNPGAAPMLYVKYQTP
jgi:hypothetical protein